MDFGNRFFGQCRRLCRNGHFEAANAFLLIAVTAAACFFAAWIWRRCRAGAEWDNINIAVALLIFLVGDVVIRTPVWWYRHAMNRGEQITASRLTLFTTLVCIGAVIGSVGAFYLLNVATPKRIRPWPLLAAIIVATGFTAVAILEPILR
jgi:hypothetical protein